MGLLQSCCQALEIPQPGWCGAPNPGARFPGDQIGQGMENASGKCSVQGLQTERGEGRGARRSQQPSAPGGEVMPALS